MKDWSNDAFAAYLAAMIDGEGCIEITRRGHVRIRIANTIKSTLDAMSDRLGYTRVIEYKRPIGKDYKRLFCLEVSSAIGVKRMFALCGRYIHMKREQMTRALEKVNRVLSDADALDARNRQILAEIAEGKVQRDIAHRHKVSPSLISYLKKGHTWNCVIAEKRARSLSRANPRSENQVTRLHG